MPESWTKVLLTELDDQEEEKKFVKKEEVKKVKKETKIGSLVVKKHEK